jgi:acyl-CoA dehydrogenase
MNEQRALLAETAAKAFENLPAGFAESWNRIEAAGFALLLVPERQGGFGGGWEDANVVLRAAALANVPLAEAIIANGLLTASGLSVAEGAVTICTDTSGAAADGKFTGALQGVAFGGECDHIVAMHDGEILRFAKADGRLTRQYRNIAGEPRADLEFVNAPVLSATSNADLFPLGALARMCQMSGLLEPMLAMTIEHAKTRQQFGRAIGNFQAIQQQLAVFASETAATTAAAASACRAADRGGAWFEIASAKLRANRAVDIATSAAHQIHGAIGITAEHALHRYTQRLWAWKSEFGNDRYWAERLGGEIAAKGADAFWPALTA